MKNQKVSQLRVHTAGKLAVLAFDSDPKKQNSDMDFYPWGVKINKFKGKALERPIVYLAPNIVEIELMPEVSEEEKRGPGRPPRDAA